MDRVKQQDSTPQNDSTLGFRWIKKIAQNTVDSRYLEFDGTMEKILVNSSSTQEKGLDMAHIQITL
jgi:hypothetical protein